VLKYNYTYIFVQYLKYQQICIGDWGHFLVENKEYSCVDEMKRYISQNRLERRIAAIDRDYLAFVSNRSFSDYFKYTRFIKLTEFVHQDEVEQLKSFCESFKGDEISGVFRFRFKDGTYRYNKLRIYTDISSTDNYKNIENGEYWFNIELVDIEALEESNSLLRAEAENLRTVLGINDEYTFRYDKSTNIFSVYRYETLQKVTVYKMDIEEWHKYMIDNNMVSKDDIVMFDWLIDDMKKYSAEISITINTNLRTKNDIYEKLRFEGRQVNNDNNHIIIGRILAADSNQKISTELIEELHYDSLTGVYNKKAITDYAKSVLKEEKKNRVTLVILDIDHFKEVNDTYGHLFGDKILTRVGNRLRSLVGDDGVVGRIGGDEFMIVFNGINDDTMLRGRLRSIRTQIKWEFANDFEKTNITTSIGAAIYPNNGTEYEDLFKKADYCLYVAKEKGRDRYVFFRDDLHRKSYEESLCKKISNMQTGSRQIKEIEFMAQIMKKMCVSPKEAISECIKHIHDTYKLDSINFYSGENLKKVYTYGKVLENCDDALYAKSNEFKKMIGEEKYIQMGFVASYYNSAPEFCRIMRSRGVFSTLQCIIGSADDVRAVITFDKCGESSQWAEYEINCSVVFASFIELCLQMKDIKDLKDITNL
jgi:diguanylate cyclase (GGDEF)-like protein